MPNIEKIEDGYVIGTNTLHAKYFFHILLMKKKQGLF